MPTPRCEPRVAALGGRIYVIGGHSMSGQPYDIVEVYDPKSDSWSTAPPMPTSRTVAAAVVLDGKIHVLGGAVGGGVVAAHEVFDPGVGRWYAAAAMRTPRANVGAAVARGRLYVFGGGVGKKGAAGHTVATAEVYDPAQDRLRPAGDSRPAPLVAPSAPQEAGGTVGLWRLDEGSGSTAHDSSGSGNHGTLVNSPAWSPGRSGSALSFNGVNNGIRVPDSPALNPSQFTIEAWIKPAADYGHIVAKNNGPVLAYCYEYDLALRDSQVHLYMDRNGSGPAAEAVAATPIPTNTWTFVAGTYDGATMKIYVNGRLDGSAAWPYGLSQTAPQALGIGYSPGIPGGGCTGAWFRGEIDEVRMLDFAATDAQIAQDAEGKGRLRPMRSPQPVSPPIATAPAYHPSRMPPQTPARILETEALPARKGNPRPDDFALVIGVERYRSLPAANFAERDAASFARYAQAVLGVPEENVILLTGQRATKTDLAKYVEEWLPRNVSEGSRVYFFYSGHGAPDPSKGTAHLVPWDGDPAFLQTSAYPLGRLYDRLGRLKAREVVVMLDACFSGAGGRSVIASGLRPLVLVKEAVLPKGDKLTVLTAASSDEVAGSLDSQRHGLFTYYLLKGLGGEADPEGSGHVSVGDLHGYVRKNVLRAAHRQNREQNPELRTLDKGLRLY